MSPEAGPELPRTEITPLVAAIRVVRERWLLIAIVTAVCVAAALAFSLTATKQYSATSSLLIQNSDLSAIVNPAVRQDSDAARDLGTNLLLVRSGAVAERAAKQLGDPSQSTALLDKVDAEAEPDADLINVSATDPDPARAAQIANAFAEQFVSYRAEVAQRQIAEFETDLVNQINSLPQDADAQRAQVQTTLNQVTALKGVSNGDVEIVDKATPPTSASSPNPKRDAFLGLVLGLVLGLGIAFLVDLFDRRVKGLEDFESAYGIRALVAIPQRLRDPSTHRERQAALEPFRILRNGLGFLAAPDPVKVVMVTSAVPGEGKSTVAAGLARAAALAGQRVVLVEADLRRPTFHEQFRLEGERRGLTTALIGNIPATELMRPALPGLKAMQILPAGPLPPNSAELLRSARMSQVLEQLSHAVDLVILDAPPLLPVADARVLLDSPRIDACLLVARAYRTTRDEVRRARAVVEAHRSRGVGLVINGLRDEETGYDDYYTASEQVVAPPREDSTAATA